MSLTLRDAQHLCWKTFKKLEIINSKESSALESADYLKAKSAEIAEKLKVNASTTNLQGQNHASKLLSELLFATFVIAEKQGVDLEEEFLQNIDAMILSFVT